MDEMENDAENDVSVQRVNIVHFYLKLIFDDFGKHSPRVSKKCRGKLFMQLWLRLFAVETNCC